MTLSLRIAVADTEPRVRGFYQDILRLLGHQIVCVARRGPELLEACRAERPDLVISNFDLPDLHGIALAQYFANQGHIPVILVSDEGKLSEQLLLACPSNVLHCLIKPLKCQDLQPAILLAAWRSNATRSLRREIARLRHSLDERKLIEQAKGILMTRARLEERDAYCRLRKLARDKRCTMIQIAKTLVTADEALSA